MTVGAVARHALDVALVALLSYRVLASFHGTRAMQVLRGALLLALATVIVQRFLPLPALSWVLGKFWSNGALILAVLFQPELRALLAHLGRRRWGRAGGTAHDLGFIDEIVAALREGVAGRVGMLIVLEQETGLRNFIGTGTVINGNVSRELLSTIFFPHTLLHDGAAILREDRLVAAGCVLPLSNNPELAKVLGTRHRAALGVSEISDALVIVLSEETATVSLVRHGQIERNLRLDDVSTRLKDHYRALGERGPLRRRAGDEP